MEPALQLALDANFGSVERWREEFTAMGKALAGGAGSLMLVFQPREGTLVNQWAADDEQTLAGGVPILALDRVEHDGFMCNINWDSVYARYQAAVYAASDDFAAPQQAVDGAVLLDVRRAAVYRQAEQVIPGARWCDPAQVALWAAELPAEREVVVYCVYGHEVGRATALRLRAAGLNARFLEGGIDGWKAAGRPLASKPVG